MLNFSQRHFISTVALLIFSFSAFANTGQDDQHNLNAEKAHSKKSAPNLVELYKVKEHATEHIRGIEAKLSATDEADQEELLVEYAQSLLYYQDRHNKSSDTKTITLKEISSSSTNRVNGKVSKVVSSKRPYSTNSIYRKALNAYKKASQLSLNKSRIKYTRELSELAVKLQNKNELIQMFDELLQHGGDESGTYLAHVDYADGLAKFKDNNAETQFLSAINMRTPVDGVEANYRYAKYLLDKNKLHEALSMLDKFSFEERNMYVHIAMLRQRLMHLLKMETQEVDAEFEAIRKRLGKSPFIGTIPKFTKLVKNEPINVLGLKKSYAYKFSHNNESDDSRGKYGNKLVKVHYGYYYSAHLYNTVEVLYNSTRGDNYLGRLAVGWAIRNRATIDMNDCTPYPGSEGHSNVLACRKLALSNSPIANTLIADLDSRYACVVHGGTTKVGESHSEMDDAHVKTDDIWASGLIWEMLYVFNGWISDPTGPRAFLTGVSSPEFNYYTGNPEGAQEWRRNNYCAENYSCKVRLGNIGGNEVDPGFEPESLCFGNSGNSTRTVGFSDTNNYFWGRQNVHSNFNLDITF